MEGCGNKWLGLPFELPLGGKTGRIEKSQYSVRDFRLPPQCQLELRSSGMLRTVYWWLVIDVSGQPISLVPISRPKKSVTKHQSKLREDLIILFELRVSGFKVKPLTP
jgi:hypothetical protein